MLCDDGWMYLGDVFVAVGVSALCICLMIITLAHINVEIKIETVEYEQQMLEYRLEHRTDDYVTIETLYKDVTEHNVSVLKRKRYSESPWLNCFYSSELIAHERFIEVDQNE